MSVYHHHDFLLFNILVYIFAGCVTSFPTNTESKDGHKSYGDKVKTLQEKLQTLEKMLAEIKDGQISNNKNGITQAPPAIKPLVGYSTSDRQMALGKTPRDDGEGSLQNSTGDDLGQFQEQLADTSKEGSSKKESTNTEEIIFTILEKLLRAKNTQTRDLQSSDSRAHMLRPIIKVGNFGEFRQHAALHTVENQLLEDLSQAASDGVTVDDIIKDIRKESLPEGSWHSRKEEVERELDTLIKHNT
ncbi:uncharacterized protein LOC121390282 [Gigantopelta aegis]|uniref:uncharacterized protein LOC121390282 n=1 Tax=Gigantopelta aegis TaxID=1735272 RepID=UPI001B88793E|nr:uncharacterized protein LOC121390282 [Gigantopelta aegis]